MVGIFTSFYIGGNEMMLNRYLSNTLLILVGYFLQVTMHDKFQLFVVSSGWILLHFLHRHALCIE